MPTVIAKKMVAMAILDETSIMAILQKKYYVTSKINLEKKYHVSSKISLKKYHVSSNLITTMAKTDMKAGSQDIYEVALVLTC